MNEDLSLLDSGLQSSIRKLTDEVNGDNESSQMEECIEKFMRLDLKKLTTNLRTVAFSGSLSVRKLFCQAFARLVSNIDARKEILETSKGQFILKRFLMCGDIVDEDIVSAIRSFQKVVTDNFNGLCLSTNNILQSWKSFLTFLFT